MSGFDEFAFGVVTSLITDGVKKLVNLGALEFFQRRRIEKSVEDATAKVVQPMLGFLAKEDVGEEKQRLLIDTCGAS